MSEGILMRAVSATELPSRPVAISVTEAERQKLAAAYDLNEVTSLTASATLEPAGGGGVTVAGHILADIVQTCVVSLVPVPEHMDETFSVRFVRSAGQLRQPGTEVVVDAEADDPPELLQGTTIDVGALVEEYFALAINPYPRAPGAELPAEAHDDDASSSPFAVLAGLAKPQKRGG